jgi:hypothetical protein
MIAIRRSAAPRDRGSFFAPRRYRGSRRNIIKES